MLGIGQITTRVAELIRGALPYAIVNNNLDQSLFSRLICYSEVQHALDAGWKWIKVKASDVDYNDFTVSTNHTTLESPWGARFTNTNTAAGNHVIKVPADFCVLTGFRTYTAGGATSNDRAGISITGDYNRLNGCLVEDSDGSGIVSGSGAVWNSFIDCVVQDADEYGFVAVGQGTRMLGCTVQNSGYTAGFYILADNFVAVADIALTGGNFEMASGADNGLLVGNLLDGTTVDGGTGNEKTGNKDF